MGKTLSEFVRSQANKRKAEGDSIWTLLIEAAEYVEALEADKSKPQKPAVPKNGPEGSDRLTPQSLRLTRAAGSGGHQRR